MGKLERLGFSRVEMQSGCPIIRFVKSNEFIFNGIYYDIVFNKETKDSIIYICYKDKKETNLVAKINIHLNEDDSRNEYPYQNILKQFNSHSDYFISSFKLTNTLFLTYSSIAELSSFYKSETPDIIKPPPESLSDN